MTENMRLLLNWKPVAFLLLLIALGKTFTSITFLFWYLATIYLYYVLVKGECPSCHIKHTIQTGVVMGLAFGLLTWIFG